MAVKATVPAHVHVGFEEDLRPHAAGRQAKLLKEIINFFSNLRASRICKRIHRTTPSQRTSSCGSIAIAKVRMVRKPKRLEFFQNDIVVGVDADIAGDLHRLAGNRLGIQIGPVGQRAGGGERVIAA